MWDDWTLVDTTQLVMIHEDQVITGVKTFANTLEYRSDLRFDFSLDEHIFDLPPVQDVSGIDAIDAGSGSWCRGVLGTTGNIYGIPCAEEPILVVDTNDESTFSTYTQDQYLHRYHLNTFPMLLLFCNVFNYVSSRIMFWCVRCPVPSYW